jgi:transcriptional regulator
MYVPRHFALNDEEAWSVVADAGAGFLVARASDAMCTVFAPVHVTADRRSLYAHVARANPWWQSVRDNDEIVVLFNVANAYVSPNLYPTKHDNPGVAPTWNYVVAEVTGHLFIHDEPAWSEQVVRSLTTQFESTSISPWSVDDAPESYVERLVRSIVGVEITVASITGSAKLSQNQPEVNHDNVRSSFAQGSAREAEVAARMRS